MRRALALAFAAALLAVPAAPAAAQPAPPAQRDWTQIAVATPEGGFRIGNPNARVKVIEYLSLACSHCATFANESRPRMLPNYVRSGQVSVEYRNILINAPDVAAAVLTRCAAPRAFFAMTDELLRTQPQWLARMDSIDEARRTQLRTLGPMQLIEQLVPILGLDQVAARHGLNPAAQRACLANQANLDRIETMQQEASRVHGVQGTPTFVINGRVVDTNVWSGIEPLLRAGS